MLMHVVHRRLRTVGLRNLDLAFPEKGRKEKLRILRLLFQGLGRQLAEFALFPRYRKESVSKIAVYDGFQNFAEARARGKGVLFLTGHFGGWEIGSFFHSLQGHPMRIVVRPIDNPFVDELVTRYRTLHGNSVMGKQGFARGLLAAMEKNETVGILMDTNMTPPQGVFVDFFGIPACTAVGIARVALHTDAAVIPAFTIWDSVLRKYRVESRSATGRTGDDEADAIANTAMLPRSLKATQAISRPVAVGAPAMEDAPAGRAFTLLAKDTSAKRRTASYQCAPTGKGSVSLPSIANCLVCSPFRTVFLEKFNPIADKCPDRNHHGSGEPNEEQCLQKQY